MPNKPTEKIQKTLKIFNFGKILHTEFCQQVKGDVDRVAQLK